MTDRRFEDLNTEELRTVDAACKAFEGHFAERRSTLEQHLAQGSSRIRGVLFEELLAIEIELRARGGSLPAIASYEIRFPDRVEQIQSVFRRIADQMSQIPELTAATVEPEVPFRSTGADLQIPKAIGRFRIDEVLGQGGFGIVYKARDVGLDRPVTIKVPRARYFSLSQNQTEAKIVAKLDHPNIVPVYEIGSNEEFPFYIVSKYIEGSSLSQRIKSGQIGNAFAVAELIAAVARALHYAHERGLVHRDVKPDNILMDGQGNPYVIDFGLALREQDIGKGPKYAGTPAYMSPEQARGEGHRVDRRSDIFGLGVLLYQLLAGRLPFRGETQEKLLERVTRSEAVPLRQHDASLPKEVDRICQKAMAKRASERYSSAQDFAEDLRLFLVENPAMENGFATGVLAGQVSESQSSTPASSPDSATASSGAVGLGSSGSQAISVVPKGLRSFDANDADFFLDLLPGPRDREGLPDSLRFWKTCIEETDPDHTFSVGLIYGPSGCGKSSFVKAGLMPRLSNEVDVVYIEASPDETEAGLLHVLQKHYPALQSRQSLKDALTALRRGHGVPVGKKVLIVLDQFEQWLHAKTEDQYTDLSQALRQCDGGQVQCIMMVRDDFWLAVSRFLRELEVQLVEGHNIALVDLFDLKHARKVLAAFGRAFGRLPENITETTKAQRKFLQQATEGLAVDDKVICVRLALFADMMKHKLWVPSTLKELGGTQGVGVKFLEDVFNAKSANSRYRLHQKAARAVLKDLLPDCGTDIKGAMRSHAALMEASGYGKRPQDFDELISILDSEIRLITPTDPDWQNTVGRDANDEFVPPAPQRQLHFQLTHDDLVHSLRDWLTRKQKESARGRAELKLEETTLTWSAKPKNRALPSLLEWFNIRILTTKRKWTIPQQKMMAKAAHVHGLRLAFVSTALFAIVFAGFTIRNSIAQRQRQRQRQQVKEKNEEIRIAESTQVARGLLQAETAQANLIFETIGGLPDEAKEVLIDAYANSSVDSNEKLHAALAILEFDPSVLTFLQDRLLKVTPRQFPYVLARLHDYRPQFVPDYWKIAKESDDPEHRFRTACALATYDSTNSNWEDRSFCEFVVEYLVGVPPTELLLWRNALRDVKSQLTAPLATVYRDESHSDRARGYATDTLLDYLSGDVAGLVDLLADASDTQFEQVFDTLVPHTRQAIPLGVAIFGTASASGTSQAQKETFARRRANAAVMLLRMGAPEPVWPRLKHNSAPLARSMIIDRIGTLGVNPDAIIARYKQEADVSIKRALLLCLGGLDVSRWPPEQVDRYANLFSDVYRNDPDAGIHGAARWMLTKWGKGEWITSIDQELRQSEQQLQNAVDSPHQWFVNGQGQTFVVLKADQIAWRRTIPNELDINQGPRNALTRQEQESLGWHDAPIANAKELDKKNRRILSTQRRIGRRFAIATTEVTKAQWDEFDAAFPGGAWRINSERMRQRTSELCHSDDCPQPVVTWYRAVGYCNWLSEHEGIPEDQWCYQPNGVGVFNEGMKAKDNFLELRGYRLPTEAEWVFACRAGSTTRHYFGGSLSLLSGYAWCEENALGRSWPVASLKPNDFGLFDMLGNVAEYCFDHALRDLTSREDSPGTAPIRTHDFRVHMGGRWDRPGGWSHDNSRAYYERVNSSPISGGFRPVRTWVD